jgi:alpha-L-arabinofuranosidase
LAVIDSASTQEELASLIEYWAAPYPNSMAESRMEQGRAVPWTESFARIYIEVADDGMLFADDRMRSSYVDWVIAQISSSPYTMRSNIGLFLLML